MSGEAGDIVTNNNSTMNVNVTSPVGNGYTPARAGQDAGTAAANRMRARGFPE
jgi:GTP cyclohydrolase III